MKKEFDFKLTISVVSLLLSLALIILGANNQFCLFFGFLFLAGALFSFSFFISQRINDKIRSLQTELDNIEQGINPDNKLYSQEEISNMFAREKELKKQRRSCRISFNAFAFMLCLVAIFVLI